jgi:regulator of protease activity HflC (stomatin/prohibitin superfamily)
MKAFLILACILSIGYWIVAKIGRAINRKKETGKSAGFLLPISIWFLIIPIAIFVAMMFITVIPSQKCGVVVTPTGVKQQSYPTGWHIVMPYYKVYTMDKTSQVYTCASRTSVSRDDEKYREYKDDATQSSTIWTPTIDGIKMGFDISASWSIDPEYAWWIYDNVSEQDGGLKGRFYWLEENVIKAKLKSALALTTSKYTPIQIYSDKRQQIQDEVFEKMKGDIAFYHLVLKQIDIREVYYNTDYEQIINKKKLEEQEVLRLVEVTKQKEELRKQELINKDIAITKAQGEAEALKIQGQAISNNPKIIELEWIKKWKGDVPTTVLGSQGIMLNLKN